MNGLRARLTGIVDGFKLTDIWKERGITKPMEYALPYKRNL